MADDPDPQVQNWRRPHQPSRLLQALSSPDSYGLVLLLIVVTYVLSATITAAWAVSLILFVQIATIWVTLHASQARRRLREVTSGLLVVSAAVAIRFVPNFRHVITDQRPGSRLSTQRATVSRSRLRSPWARRCGRYSPVKRR